jgi:hypothetical protein
MDLFGHQIRVAHTNGVGENPRCLLWHMHVDLCRNEMEKSSQLGVKLSDFDHLGL